MNKRDKQILIGLFLSKFDKEGLKSLGFNSFTEAFNTLALSIKANPNSIKNYRDEFDPYFSNNRKGWHKRPLRQYCLEIMEEYSNLNLYEFGILIKSEISSLGDIEAINGIVDIGNDTVFAKRLATGQAAEKYFENVYKSITDFEGYKLINTTGYGCGFDYKLIRPDNPFVAVEVKGILSSSGSIVLTNKEYLVAQALNKRFYLFVVKDFSRKPFYSVLNDPINSGLIFKCDKIVSTQINWRVSI